MASAASAGFFRFFLTSKFQLVAAISLLTELAALRVDVIQKACLFQYVVAELLLIWVRVISVVQSVETERDRADQQI